MSTSYYRLKPPVTHIRVEDKTPGHTKLVIWVNHGLSGTLVLQTEEVRDFLRILVLYEDDSGCPLRTHWGGPERGTIVTINDNTLPDEAVVISQYGELLTVSEVKVRDGAKRKDGFPTELFGYEDLC